MSIFTAHTEVTALYGRITQELERLMRYQRTVAPAEHDTRVVSYTQSVESIVTQGGYEIRASWKTRHSALDGSNERDGIVVELLVGEYDGEVLANVVFRALAVRTQTPFRPGEWAAAASELHERLFWFRVGRCAVLPHHPTEPRMARYASYDQTAVEYATWPRPGRPTIDS